MKKKKYFLSLLHITHNFQLEPNIMLALLKYTNAKSTLPMRSVYSSSNNEQQTKNHIVNILNGEPQTTNKDQTMAHSDMMCLCFLFRIFMVSNINIFRGFMLLLSFSHGKFDFHIWESAYFGI